MSLCFYISKKKRKENSMKKYTRSVYALLLVVLMAVGMMPFGAFATDTGTDPAEVIEEPIEP